MSLSLSLSRVLLLILPLILSTEKLMAQSCTIETVAGNGASGYSGDGGLAIEAMINPNSLAIDSSGNLFIADQENSRIRKVTPSGIISTFAGSIPWIPAHESATGIVLGDGGPATSAIIDPTDIAFDSEGNLYIADYGNYRIRKITPAGIISTVVGGGSPGLSQSRESGIPVSSFAFGVPSTVAVNANGDIYFSDSSRGEVFSTINKVSEGVVHRVAGTGRRGYSGDGGSALEADIAPADLILGNNGDLYFSTIPVGPNFGYYVRKISAEGIISTVAGNSEAGLMWEGPMGDGGLATNAYLSGPSGLAMDSQGNIFVAERYGARVRKISLDGIITTVAGNGLSGSFSGDGGPATAARLNHPLDVALDSGGNIYIADTNNHRIRKVTCRPDLVIESASIVGGGGRRMVNVRVTIANRGEGKAQGPFSIGVRPNWFTKAGFNSVQQILRRGQSLGAGETIERTLRLPAADSMELTIDSGGRVDESDEENNTFSLVP